MINFNFNEYFNSLFKKLFEGFTSQKGFYNVNFNFARQFKHQEILLDQLKNRFIPEGKTIPNYLGSLKSYLKRIVPFTDASGKFTGSGAYGGIIKDFEKFRHSIDMMKSQSFNRKADLDRIAYEFSSITSKDMKKQAEATIKKLKEQFDYVKKLSIQANEVYASNSTGASYVRNLKFDDKSLNPSQRKIISDFLQRTNAKDPYQAVTKTYVDNVKYVSKNLSDAGRDFEKTIRNIDKSIKEFDGKKGLSKSFESLLWSQTIPLIEQSIDIYSMRARQRGEMYIRAKDYERGFERLDSATRVKGALGTLTSVANFAILGGTTGGAPGAVAGVVVGFGKGVADWYNESEDTENTKREEYINAIRQSEKLSKDIKEKERDFAYNSKFNAVSRNFLDQDTYKYLERTYINDELNIKGLENYIYNAQQRIKAIASYYIPEDKLTDDSWFSSDLEKYGILPSELSEMTKLMEFVQDSQTKIDKLRQRRSNFESLRTSVSGKFLNLRLADLDRDFNRSSINIANESTKLGEFGYYTDSSYFDKAETKLLGYISELKSIMDSITGNTAEDITRRNTVSDKLFSAEQNLESLRREKTSYGINIDTNNKAVSRQRETFYLTDLLNKNFPDIQTIKNYMASYKAEAEKARTEYYSLSEKENKTEDDFKKIQRLAQDLSFSVKAYNDLDAKLKSPVSQIFGSMGGSAFIADQLGSFSRWAGVQDGNSAMIKEIQTTNSFLRTIAEILRSEPLGYSIYE